MRHVVIILCLLSLAGYALADWTAPTGVGGTFYTQATYVRHIQIPFGGIGPGGTAPGSQLVGTVGCLQFTHALKGTQQITFTAEAPNDWDGTDLTVEFDAIAEAEVATGDDVGFTITCRSIAPDEDVTTGTVETLAMSTGAITPTWAANYNKHISVTLPQTGSNQTIVAQDHIYCSAVRAADSATEAICVSAVEIMYNSQGIPTAQ